MQGSHNGHGQNPNLPAVPNAEDMRRIFFDTNRGLTGTVPPRPDPAAAGGPCSADRMVFAGGFTTQLLAHPSFVPLEFLFRKLPEEGVFSASSEQNFTFELGAIEVPGNMVLAFTDFSFQLARLNGAAPGDTVPLEDERFATLMGYDLVVDEYRKANVHFELDPTPIDALKDAFTAPPTAGTIATGTGENPGGTGASNIADLETLLAPFQPSSPPQPPSQNAFNAANFVRSASPSGAALSALPQRRGRLGARNLPFTFFVRENQRVGFKVIIFKPIPIPLAYFEVDATGFLFPANVMADIMACQNPSVSQGAGR